MIYLRAGLYAEGSTDYAFMMPLLDRVIDEVAALHFPGQYEVGETKGIDALRKNTGNRAERIAAAIEAHWDECTLFVIHSDGAGDPKAAEERCITPGIAAFEAAFGERRLAAAACVPVRETEAWMLVDPEVFEKLSGHKGVICPVDPEGELDPKKVWEQMLRQFCGDRYAGKLPYAFFGEQVSLARLRRLPAFCGFERRLLGAIRVVGGGG